MHVIVSLQFQGSCVVICTDLWRQETAYTGGCGYSGDIREPIWWNGHTLAQNARDVGSIFALGIIFPIFVTLTTYTGYINIHNQDR